MDNPEKAFLTEAETAQYLGVSRSFLRKARCYGGGPRYCRLGKKAIRYRKQDLEAWAEENAA